MKCSVFAPSHITGFFEIFDHKEPLKRGSRGAGVALDKGVLTSVEISEDHGSKSPITVSINSGEDPKNTTITFKVLELMEREFGINRLLNGVKVNIDHAVDVPIGAGFGISAACALGTALCTAELLDMNLTLNRAASIAHLAEIEMQSGLGDVVAEVNGGITLRILEGAPGIGLTDKMLINPQDDLYVICKSLGGIETSEIIGDPKHKDRINRTGNNMLNKLLKSPVPETFLKLSKKFAVDTGLLSSDVADIINILEDETMGASMAMLGNTAFALSKTPETSLNDVIIAGIDHCGCRFVKNLK
jgi:pantoate kinase